MQVIDRRTMLVAAVAAASVLASAIALYVLLQPSGTAVVPAQSLAPASSQAAAAPGVRPLDQMAERLAARLGKDGGSAADWALLGRSYREMGRWPEAVKAFEKSIALAPDDAQVRSDLDAARAKSVNAPR